MNKKLLAGLLASATVLGLSVMVGTSADAAPVDGAETGVGIGFSDHGPGVTPGPLEIKWAPLKFDFGSTNTVNTAAATFNETTGSKKYVVISDTRGGASDAWELYASLGNMMSGADQLTGAQLKFDVTEVGYQGTAAPEAAGSIVAVDPLNTSAVTAANFTLSQGAAATKVFEDAGPGTYQGLSGMEMDNIQLDVPANAADSGKQYSGKVVWSLDNTI